MLKAKPVNVDELLLEAPERGTTTLKGIATFIKHSTLMETDRARVAFAWVAKNIDYDVQKYFSAHKSLESAQDTFTTGKATCKGFSSILVELLKCMDIEAVSIPGCAKGYGYDPERREQDNNHDWNAIKLEGEWQLADVAWGAGLVAGRAFIREYEDFYFCTPPALFARSHFPNDPKWQLIPHPLTRDQFESLPKFKPLFYKSGFTGSKPEQSVLECIGNPHFELKVLLGSGKPRLQAALKKIADKAYDEIPLTTLVQRKEDVYEINVQVPEDGQYNLVLYAPKSPADKTLTDVVTYRIKAKDIDKAKAMTYPEQYLCFDEMGGFLFAPLNGRVPLGASTEFKVKVKGVEEVNAIVGENWVPLEKGAEDTFSGKVDVDDKKLGLYAKRPGAKNFEALLVYQVDDTGKHPQSKAEEESKVRPLKKELTIIKECGLENFPKEGVLRAKGNKLRLELDTAPDCELLATLSTEKDEDFEAATLVQRIGTHFFVDVLFPDNRKYNLSIFAKRKSKEGSFPFAMKYHVEAEKGTKTEQRFPELYAGFKAAEAFIYEPLDGILKPQSAVPFKIKANKASAVSVFMGEVEVPLEEKPDGMFVSAHPVQMPKGGVLGVFASFKGEETKTMRCLVEYKVK